MKLTLENAEISKAIVEYVARKLGKSIKADVVLEAKRASFWAPSGGDSFTAIVDVEEKVQ